MPTGSVSCYDEAPVLQAYTQTSSKNLELATRYSD